MITLTAAWPMPAVGSSASGTASAVAAACSSEGPSSNPTALTPRWSGPLGQHPPGGPAPSGCPAQQHTGQKRRQRQRHQHHRDELAAVGPPSSARAAGSGRAGVGEALAAGAGASLASPSLPGTPAGASVSVHQCRSPRCRWPGGGPGTPRRHGLPGPARPAGRGGPGGVDLGKGTSRLAPPQGGAGQVVAGVGGGGSSPAGWESARQRGRVGVEGEGHAGGGDPIGIVQVHHGHLWCCGVVGSSRHRPSRPSVGLSVAAAWRSGRPGEDRL
jgi:hypothetical protein